MFQFRHIVVLFVVLLGVLVITVSFSGTSNASYAITESHGAFLPADDESNRPIYEGDARELDVQNYANYYGVTFEEADYRLQMQDALDGLGSELEEREHDTFAGFWIQNTPEYRFVAMFTRDGQKIMEPYLEGKPYVHLIEMREAAVTLAELHRIRDDFLLTLEDIDVPFDHSINVHNNRVELYVLHKDTFLDTLNEADIILPNYVVVVGVDGLSREIGPIYAGLATSPCTSGFSVIKNGELGITTAGHCGYPVTYNGRNLPYKSGIWSGNYDVQWHTAPDFWVRHLAWDGTYNRYVYGHTPYSNQEVGQLVCKFGKITQGGCGEITNKLFNGNYIRVHSATQDLGEPGDSGGPWIRYNSAYGIMTADIEPGNDAYYMTIDKISILGLHVYTGKSFVYQHVFWSATNCTEHKTPLDNSGNPIWGSTSIYACRTYAPGSGTIESYSTFVSGGKLREAMWRGGNGYVRDIPIKNDGTVDWTAAPNWTQCCSGGGPSEQGAYSTGGYLYQHVFWSATNCTEHKTLLDNSGNPIWGSTSIYACRTYAPGSGTIESYSTFVSGGKLREAMWRGGNGYVRDIPIKDDGTVNWAAAPNWAQCCSGGGPSEQGAYVLSEP